MNPTVSRTADLAREGPAFVLLDFVAGWQDTGMMDDADNTVSGDTACWLPRVCVECGALVEGELPATCWRCGAEVGGSKTG